jgi:hypothetical protein
MTVPLIDYLFGPLDSEYCLYFYVLSILAFVSFLMIIIGSVIMTLQGKMDSKVAVTMLFTALMYFVSYFQSRLLYSMCGHKEGMFFGKSNYKKRK